MTSVSITGAAGFIGSCLTSHLKSRGIKVVPVSRRMLPETHHVEDYSQTPVSDVLIHLAEEPDRGEANNSGEEYLQYSSNLLKVLSGRFQRIIYASSGVVYGDESECPCKVDMPVFGSDIYSRSKLQNEKVVLELGGCVVRLSNIFGIGMATNNVMSDIIHQIPGSGPLRVRDDTPIRDFLSVSDAASAFGQIIEGDFSGIMNVGSGTGTSINRLAKLLLASGGQEDRDIIATKPSPRQSTNVLDISETVKNICWSPSPSLKDQLNQLVISRKIN